MATNVHDSRGSIAGRPPAAVFSVAETSRILALLEKIVRADMAATWQDLPVDEALALIGVIEDQLAVDADKRFTARLMAEAARSQSEG